MGRRECTLCRIVCQYLLRPVLMYMSLNFEVSLLILGLDDPSIGPSIIGVDFIYVFKSSVALVVLEPTL